MVFNINGRHKPAYSRETKTSYAEHFLQLDVCTWQSGMILFY